MRPPRASLLLLLAIPAMVACSTAAEGAEPVLVRPAAAAAATAAAAVTPAHYHHGGGGGRHGGDPCDLLAICRRPGACPIMRETPPARFSVVFHTTAGPFTVDVVTAWAPPLATRFWQLSRLRYMTGGRFFRVTAIDFSPSAVKKPPFVVQFGYRGDPAVDKCWQDALTSNATAPVVAPGNVRGTVSFAMNALPNKTEQTPYCEPGAQYCALGFSNNIFINLGNNSRLNAPGFAIFGSVSAPGMAVVDALYARYGDVRELCGVNSTDVYCNGFGPACQGVSVDRLLSEGNAYLTRERPLLDAVSRTELLRCSGKHRGRC